MWSCSQETRSPPSLPSTVPPWRWSCLQETAGCLHRPACWEGTFMYLRFRASMRPSPSLRHLPRSRIESLSPVSTLSYLSSVSPSTLASRALLPRRAHAVYSRKTLACITPILQTCCCQISGGVMWAVHWPLYLNGQIGPGGRTSSALRRQWLGGCNRGPAAAKDTCATCSR